MGVRFCRAQVTAVEAEGDGWQIVLARALDDPAAQEPLRVFCETRLLSRLAPGDRVILNTTARHLGLGTGGLDFAYWVEGRIPAAPSAPGHIMKLRYTPLQRRVLSIEEDASPKRATYLRQEAEGLAGRPVVVTGLHSQLAGVVAGIRTVTDAPVAFVQTDAGALPASFSRLLPVLRERGGVSVVVTVGHAYGGDYEAVSAASGLLAAAAAGARIVVIGPGPGIAGTGTRYGTTAIEQASLIDLAAALGAVPIACLRLSQADRRERHRPVSHHSLSSLELAARSAWVPVPRPDGQQVRACLVRHGVDVRHAVVELDGRGALDWLRQRGIAVQTMGRGLDDDPLAFLGAGAAGRLAGLISSHPRS